MLEKLSMLARFININLKQGNFFLKEKTVLKFAGLSISRDASPAYKAYSVFFLCTVYSYPFLHLKDIVTEDFNTVADMLGYDFCAWLAFIKTSVMIRNRTRINDLLEKLEKKPFAPNRERGGIVEEKLLKTCATITSIQALAYWVSSVLAVVVHNGNSLLKRIRNDDHEKWELPFGTFTFFGSLDSPIYEITWSYQFLCYASLAAHLATIDLLCAAVLARIACQFKILQLNLTTMAERAYKMMMTEENRSAAQLQYDLKLSVNCSKIPWKYLKNALSETVQHHLDIIKAANELEEIISGLLLYTFLATLGTLCFMVFRVTLAESRNYMMLFPEVSAITLQVLLNCHWGEEILHESQKVREAVYEANFVGSDLRFQKGLVLIMARSFRPIQLSAGKFTYICLSTFIWIIKTSYSSFMVLRNYSGRST